MFSATNSTPYRVYLYGMRVRGDSTKIYSVDRYTQPVNHERGQLRMPTLLLIGDKDTTAIGKDAAPSEVRAPREP
ncbi:hypothetical protein PSP6_350012 [Paraburkholderia tropica]|uniref:hypothetical protein n=1 Tax=Paraburkholderia tropica TaxID=92647 RepID=UPI001CAB57E0|nr:hypothetical protein PSP6_350012 [Paraburkholderia tropica]